MDNYVGKRLDGRYEIQEIIGVGGMSVVYKAYDNVDDRIVAVKILKEEFLNNDDFKRRFKNESKAIALLSHENIVKVYDVNFGEKLQYIVMEYIDGITLKEFINKQGSITWNDALFFMTQILRAVQHAHDKGIVHRDIKPQNIILLPNGNLKVTDFGIARFSRSDTKTLTEQAIGSVHYISPEQAKGEYTDEKADIYSIGVVLYEMLSGKVPFEADSAVSVALMQVNSNAEELRKINPDIPLGLEQICFHAMQKNPADRYQSATEMLLDIEEIVKDPNKTFNYVNNEVVEEPSQEIEPIIDDEEYEETEDYDDSSRKKKTIAAIVVGVIVLIAAIIGIVMMFTSGMNTKTQKLENFVGFSYDQLQDNESYNYEFVAEYEKSDQYDP
ncbi:MAG: protein kinase, partial [Eubacterium coprostanoligenes]